MNKYRTAFLLLMTAGFQVVDAPPSWRKPNAAVVAEQQTRAVRLGDQEHGALDEARPAMAVDHARHHHSLTRVDLLRVMARPWAKTNWAEY
jgi:hypothetical protein